MFSVSDIHEFFTKVIDEVKNRGAAELQALAADVKTAWVNEKNDILAQVQASSPEVQQAVQHALALAEQALLAVLAAHGL